MTKVLFLKSSSVSGIICICSCLPLATGAIPRNLGQIVLAISVHAGGMALQALLIKSPFRSGKNVPYIPGTKKDAGTAIWLKNRSECVAARNDEVTFLAF